jgi:hypothetical protein
VKQTENIISPHLAAERKGSSISTDDRAILARLRRKLRNAKHRARYWSGLPSFTGFGFSPRNRNRDHDAEYEVAIADIDSLRRRIRDITGVEPKAYDPRADFHARFAKASARIGGAP